MKLKFATNAFVAENGRDVCVLGALALSQGISRRRLVNMDDGEVASQLSKKLKISPRTLLGLISLNDSRHWTRLTDKLRSLEILHLVRPFALNTPNKTNRATVSVK